MAVVPLLELQILILSVSSAAVSKAGSFTSVGNREFNSGPLFATIKGIQPRSGSSAFIRMITQCFLRSYVMWGAHSLGDERMVDKGLQPLVFHESWPFNCRI